MVQLKTSLIGGVIISMLLMAGFAQAAREEEEPKWPMIKEDNFGDKEIRANADDIMSIEAPMRAEDAAITPVSIRSNLPADGDLYIKELHIIIDENPEPYSAHFTFSEKLGQLDLDTRMRVNSYSDVRAIAELNDGTLHMVSRFVKASGGCSAPAMKDAEAAIERMGKMQIRTRGAEAGKMTKAQVMISHPNYTGLQYDQIRRKWIPAHYIDQIDINYGGETLIQVNAGISISEDPSFRFSFTPEELGDMEVIAHDTKDNTYRTSKAIN